MIGVLMLNTHFPRFVGDIGNPQSFSSPPIYQVVEMADVGSIVTDNELPAEMIDELVYGAKELQKKGAHIIGTSCGFLASAQQAIQQAVDIPVLCSSLLLIPVLRTMFGADAHIGVLTFDANKLGPRHFQNHLDEHISIHGLDQNSHWYQCISSSSTEMDADTAGADSIQVAEDCLNKAPQTKVLLLECTNLSPWKSAIKKQFHLPVFDLIDTLEWIASSSMTKCDT